MNLRFLFIGVTILLIFSCKKGKITYLPCSHPVYINSYDTVFPSPYLMTYPGSWWEYSDGTIDSCYSWEQVSFTTSFLSGQCTSYVHDINILPYSSSVIFKDLYLLDGLGGTPSFNSSGYVSFDTEITPVNGSNSRFTKLVGESFGDVSGGEINLGSNTRGKTIEILGFPDSLTVNGVVYYDIVHTQERDYIMYGSFGGGGPIQRCYVYYAKNVGIIRREYSYDGGSGFGVVTTQDLVNYHIEPY